MAAKQKYGYVCVAEMNLSTRCRVCSVRSHCLPPPSSSFSSSPSSSPSSSQVHEYLHHEQDFGDGNDLVLLAEDDEYIHTEAVSRYLSSEHPSVR
jgi:hypothetical protein